MAKRNLHKDVYLGKINVWVLPVEAYLTLIYNKSGYKMLRLFILP